MSDFTKYLAKHRRNWITLTEAQQKQLATYYVEWAGRIKSEIPYILNKSTLTTKKIALNNLLREASKITDGFTKILDKSVLDSANLGVEANKYIVTQYQQSLFDKGHAIDLKSIMTKLPSEAVKVQASMIFTDGLKLSERIWRLDKITKGQIERIVLEAISTGRSASDPILNRTLASLLNPNYTGKLTTLHGRSVSYEASRLLRTQSRIAHMEADRMSSLANPGVQMVEWRRGAYEDCDICDRLAAEGPYKPNEIPIHSHPNCVCSLVPIAEDIEKFTDRYLEFMDNPKSQPDLMQWMSDYGRKMAA